LRRIKGDQDRGTADKKSQKLQTQSITYRLITVV